MTFFWECAQASFGSLPISIDKIDKTEELDKLIEQLLDYLKFKIGLGWLWWRCSF
jgi:hypothetical protein